jgi:hypothetical protein
VTEVQWLTCATNPTWMVNAIRNRVSARKLRLFAVACVRSILPRVRDVHREDVVRVLDVAERFAEGVAFATELEATRRDTIPWDTEISAAIETCNPDSRMAPLRTLRTLGFGYPPSRKRRRRSPGAGTERRDELERQTALAREIFGNPFRTITVVPLWQSETVTAIAHGAYTERAFDRLPILADALEDAGCEEVELLAHCRSPHPHALGCWALDLLLSARTVRAPLSD